MANQVRELIEKLRVKPGDKVKLKASDADGDGLFKDEADTKAETLKIAAQVNELQDRLYAERQRSLLVVLQGMDTSGKDGTIRSVFNTTGPIGIAVTAFGRPSERELAHDYLWRVHAACPRRGTIGIFNRSHYEDVLVPRAHKLLPKSTIDERYGQINAFEKMLTENGTVVLKFMLHISADKQAERLQERLDEREKNWKFNPADLEDRALWEDFEEAYETLLEKCSTEEAPWYVIPADHKWVRNAAVGHIVKATLEDMDPKYPKPDWKPSDFKVV
ncbi:polyphosphate kinase 2 family protein [Microvirga antarctica]|uniref:polyphosphate kinase 2 family protein n=1 Tax=Microvirga antarctica TaxID=2819233 RepID=UPI001B31757F|nr:polyphosphate kinase 2 family protein [Microvirga antarctica]